MLTLEFELKERAPTAVHPPQKKKQYHFRDVRDAPSPLMTLSK